MQRRVRKWRTYIPGDEADCTGALSDRALSPLCLAFPPRLLLFFLSAGFVFLVISVSLYSLFFIISGFSPDFCLFIPLSFFSVRPSGFSLGFFPPFFFVFLFWFLLWFSPGMLCFWCSCCWRWSFGAAAEDGALELELLLKTKSRACCRNTQVSLFVFHLSSSSSWPFSGFYKARECHAVAQQMKRTRRIVTIIMKTHHGAGETSIFHSGLMKRRRWTVLFQTALFLGWEWSFAVWSQKSWNCVIRPPYSGKSPFNFAPG